MRRVFKFLIALLASALLAWLGFVGWSIYLLLAPGADDAPRDLAERAAVQSSPVISREASAHAAPPAALQARDEPRAQADSRADLQSPHDISGCDDPNAAVQWYVADPLRSPREPAMQITSAEMLEERAMAGDALAQWLIGFHLQQQVVMRTPTKDRASISPQRFEYMRNVLILAVKNGSRSAAWALADAYIATERDVVETAAWLRIAGGERLPDAERQGIIVLSEEQRAESLRVAAVLAELYNLPVSRGTVRVVTDGDTSDPASDDCISSRSDPYSRAVADLETYRADVERNSFAPGIVSEAELRRRFRDIRLRLVTSLRLGNRSALPMLVTLHRASPASEDAVAAAVWARVDRELYNTASDAHSPDASEADTTPALPPSAELPILSQAQITDPHLREVVDNLRRGSIRAGILADQYRVLFDLD